MKKIMKNLQTLRIAFALMIIFLTITPTRQVNGLGTIEKQSPQNISIPNMPLDAPITIVNEPFDEWVIHDGNVYWMDHCIIPGLQKNNDETQLNTLITGSVLKRTPISGGAVSTITTSTGCRNFQQLTVDNSGIYYFNGDDKRIETIPFAPNATPKVLVATASIGGNGSVDRIWLDTTVLYYTAGGFNLSRIAKTTGAQTATPQVSHTASSIRDIAFDDSKMYISDSTGMYWADKTCATLPCAKQKFSNESGFNLILGEDLTIGNPRRVYFINSGVSSTIKSLDCTSTNGACFSTIYYTSPNNTFSGQLKIVETPNPNPFSSQSIRTLFWVDRVTQGATTGGRILRKRVGATTAPDELYSQQLSNVFPTLFTDTKNVFFSEKSLGLGYRILSLALTASVIQYDFMVQKIEVTQGIQNLANEAPLVTEKPTYVRVYGKNNLLDGVALGVEVELHGTKNGAALPGSPLRPIVFPNIVGNFTSGDDVMRGEVGGSNNWLFQLPGSWINELGNLSLRAKVNPHRQFADNVATNDELTTSVNFKRGCTINFVMYPVATQNGVYRLGDPGFYDVVHKFRQLWPIKTIAGYEGETMWHPVIQGSGQFGLQPYDMAYDGWLSSGAGSLLQALWFKNFWDNLWNFLLHGDNDEPGCSTSRPYSVGMIPPNTKIIHDGQAVAGMGRMDSFNSFTKFEETNNLGNSWNSLYSGTVFAQELGHNANRYHINCGQPSNIDSHYPYQNPCQLEDGVNGANASYWGFDATTYTPIPYNTASDFMSYTPTQAERQPGGKAQYWQGKWVGDYTYKKILERITTPAQTNIANKQTPSGILQIQNLGNIIIINGQINETKKLGVLENTYVLTTTSLNQQAKDQLISQINASYATNNEFNAISNIAHSHGDLIAHNEPFDKESAPKYHIRLRNSKNAILDDRDITEIDIDKHGTGDNIIPFIFVAPASADDVASIQLLADETILAARKIGSAKPSIKIIEPVGKQSYDQSMKIRWTVSDSDLEDLLNYMIDYSYDDGKTWKNIIHGDSKVPISTTIQEYLVQNPNALAGSIGKSRIRITVSDGFHTSVTTTDAFTVASRKPIARIIAPAIGASFDAGANIPFIGIGQDTEDGTLGDKSLSWKLNGITLGAGSNLNINDIRPGAHVVELKATDSSGNTAVQTRTLHINPLSIPDTSTPILNGICDDQAYSKGRMLQLPSYADGNRAQAWMIRDTTSLWLCFNGLARGNNAVLGSVGLMADVNNSRDSLPQTNDIGFYVREDGLIFGGQGNSNKGIFFTNTSGHAARVTSKDGLWSAELQIPITALGGLGHTIGVALGHLDVQINGDKFLWGKEVDLNQPSTWAQVVLGNAPKLKQIEPNSGTTSKVGFTLTVTGTDFAPDTNILWKGTALTTTFINSSTLQATVGAKWLTTGEVCDITVKNRSTDDAPSSPVFFELNNPIPKIKELNPNSAIEGVKTVNLVITGSDFMPGASVLWDGLVISSTFVSSSELRATIETAILTPEHDITVLVKNPEPNQGPSDTVIFSVSFNPPSITGTHKIFLPLSGATLNIP